MCQDCQHVAYHDKYDCWDKDPPQSKGLLERWWTGCVGNFWDIAFGSANAGYRFIGPIAAETKANIYKLTDSNWTLQAAFDDPNGAENKNKIGHQSMNSLGVPTIYTTECLASSLGFGKHYFGYSSPYGNLPVYYNMWNDLKNGWIGAMIVEESVLMADPNITEIMPTIELVQELNCYAGQGIMIRPDDECRFDWFNKGLENILENGLYDDICDKYEDLGQATPGTLCGH
jgi:hypothetical protein